MVDFRFMYEHKAREMESISLLIYELNKRGYSCDFFPCNGMGGKPKEKARVVVTPYLYTDAHIDSLSRYLYGTDKLVNLQWEQVFRTKYDGDPTYFHYPKEHAKNAIHLCWGQHEADSLLKCGINKNNIFVTGPIHMDFLRNEFNGYYLDKDSISQTYNLDEKKEWILFISSFAGDARKTDPKGDVIDETDSDKAKTIFLSWIETILEERQDSIFIYRPHPNEKSDFRLTQLANKYQNFRLIGELSVKQWILISDKILTWISTSTGEIYFSGKKCIIVRPIPIKRNDDMVILKDATKVNSLEELREKMNTISEFPIDRNTMETFYDFGNVPSYIRICNVLEMVLKNNIHCNLNTNVKYPLFLKVKKAFSKSPFYYRYIKHMASIPSDKAKQFPYSVRKLIENSKMRYRDYITDKEVASIILSFKRLGL